jgi:hypothetical protein
MRNTLTFLLLLTCLQSFGQIGSLVKTDPLKRWQIDEYTVVYSKKLGPAGPQYYEYDIFKNNKYLSYAAYLLEGDSCSLLFRERNSYYVTFNLCNKTKSVLSSDKAELDESSIDSITIRPYDSIKLKGRNTYEAPFYDTIITKNFDTTITKKLTEKQIRKFVERWNTAKVNGYYRLGKAYDYLVIVYTKNGTRRFRTLNPFITENGAWSYETKSSSFFDELWMQ